MKYDVERLREEADIEAVIDHLGIKTFRSGVNTFLHCPSPEHNDRHPTNCYFSRGWNHVFCQVCQKSFNAIDLIMWTTGCTFRQAIATLAEIEGNPEWAIAENDGETHEPPTVDRKSIRLIRLKVPSRIDVPVAETKSRMALSRDLPKGCIEMPEAKNHIIGRRLHARMLDSETLEAVTKERIKTVYPSNLRKSKKLRALGIDYSYLEEQNTKIVALLDSITS